jgi:hypothetical protein
MSAAIMITTTITTTDWMNSRSRIRWRLIVPIGVFNSDSDRIKFQEIHPNVWDIDFSQNVQLLSSIQVHELWQWFYGPLQKKTSDKNNNYQIAMIVERIGFKNLPYG